MTSHAFRIQALASAGLVALALGGLTGCNRGGAAAGDTVATVNGDAITKESYYRLLERKPTVTVVPPVSDSGVARVAGTLGFQAIADLIKNQLIVQLAKDEGVPPTDGDLVNELKYQQALKPSFLTDLQKEGFTKEAVLGELRYALAQEKIVTKGITVPESEVDNYIKANPKSFEEPKAVQMSWIRVTTPEKKAQVDTQLGSGQSFPQVAELYSEAPNARALKGRFPQNVYDTFPPALKKIADETSEGKTTDWIKDGDAFVKFSVEQKRDAKPILMTPRAQGDGEAPHGRRAGREGLGLRAQAREEASRRERHDREPALHGALEGAGGRREGRHRPRAERHPVEPGYPRRTRSGRASSPASRRRGSPPRRRRTRRWRRTSRGPPLSHRRPPGSIPRAARPRSRASRG